MTHTLKTFLALGVSALVLAACGDADTVVDTAESEVVATQVETSTQTAANFQSAVSVSDDQLLDEPFIYAVKDADSEIILYPTFHILPEGIDWKSERLDAAIARADEVWYELPVGADTDPALQGLVMELGMSETPLTERLSPEQAEAMKTKLEAIGIPLAMVEPMQPWFAAINIPVVQMMQAGYNPMLGVESQLQQVTGGKGQRAFETAEQQLRFFADLPEDKQVEYLMATLEDAEEGMALMDAMAAAWASGDMEVLENEFIAEMRDETPELYDVLIVKRNTDWAEQLDAEMKGEGVDFVAVGAGHLIGPDSVPAMMAAKGYDVEVLTLKE